MPVNFFMRVVTAGILERGRPNAERIEDRYNHHDSCLVKEQGQTDGEGDERSERDMKAGQEEPDAQK